VSEENSFVNKETPRRAEDAVYEYGTVRKILG